MRMGSIRKLTEEEIQERLAQYSKHPDPKIRDEVVLQYANLVESIGRRFMGSCEPLEDLVQEGYIGLIASVDKYDAGKNVKFSTYATHFIIGQIKHYLRDKGKIIKEPAWLQELNQRMTRVIEGLNQKFGRQPNEKEIGEVMQLPEKTVREMLMTREVFKVTSLDGDKDDSSGSRETEKISDQKVVAFQLPIEDKIVLETSLEMLKDIEQQVIADYFYKGLNQTEIAKKLNISCNYVSHILRNGTKKLRKILTTEEIRDTQMQRSLLSKRSQFGDESIGAGSVLDSTTGLYNQEYYLQRLDEEVSRACRDKCKLAVVLVNICLPEEMSNYIRMVRMDDYLYSVGQKMRDSVRKVDVLARFGDTCFALILPHTSTHAKVVVDRLVRIVSTVQVDSSRGAQKMYATAQVGLAVYPTEASSSEMLLQQAAEAMGVSLEQLMSISSSELRKAA